MECSLDRVNSYSKFQVNVFSNDRDNYKLSKFLHDVANDKDTKALAIPWVSMKKAKLTRGVTECNLILLPALSQKVVFCTDGHTDGQTDTWTG